MVLTNTEECVKWSSLWKVKSLNDSLKEMTSHKETNNSFIYVTSRQQMRNIQTFRVILKEVDLVTYDSNL